MDPKKVLMVIPARGGSKGLPGKNIKLLNKKPVIAYSIEAALNSKYCDKLVVTTDDKDIAEIAKEYGAEVPFIRPKELAEDTSHTPPVIEHCVLALKEKGYENETLMVLQPTSPLRQASHINEAVELFQKSKEATSLIGVHKVGLPPWWLLKEGGNGLGELFLGDFEGRDPYLMERQEFPPLYIPNGSIYMIKTQNLLDEKVIKTKKCKLYLMDDVSSMDIDTPKDFDLIEQVMNQKK